MRAKTINEVHNFERGEDPKKSMDIGVSQRLDAMKGMSAFTHWLYNVDHRFIDQVWGEGTMLANHLGGKWEGILSRSKENYMNPDSLMKFVRELDDENRKMLYDYILEKHKDKWT